MTKLILFLLLIVVGAPSVQAGDTKDSLRHSIEFCDQFVIRDPDPRIRLQYRYDCFLNDWDAPCRWYDDQEVGASCR
jgi:hypothetical protein